MLLSAIYPTHTKLQIKYFTPLSKLIILCVSMCLDVCEKRKGYNQQVEGLQLSC